MFLDNMKVRECFLITGRLGSVFLDNRKVRECFLITGRLGSVS